MNLAHVYDFGVINLQNATFLVIVSEDFGKKLNNTCRVLVSYMVQEPVNTNYYYCRDYYSHIMEISLSIFKKSRMGAFNTKTCDFNLKRLLPFPCHDWCITFICFWQSCKGNTEKLSIFSQINHLVNSGVITRTHIYFWMPC